jgi:PKD repeat protein
MSRFKFSVAAAIVTVAAGATACTVHKQSAPDLTGPSELGTSIVVQVSPDVLAQDGASQSLITVTARDANGQPVRNLSLRAQITVNGIIADFGTLSARNIVTDANGRATTMYTAPAAAGAAVDAGTLVSIDVTPIGSDFGNSTARSATIRLVPPNIVIPPDGFKPLFTFTPTAPTDHQVVQFDASQSTSGPGNPITTYSWNFGDGGTASSGSAFAQHSFNSPGTFIVTMTIADAFGRSAQAVNPITISPGGVGLTADFVTSPSSPVSGQTVFFNAATSRAAPGTSIVSYDWNFGDGTTGSGPTPTHAYTANGGYTVSLTVTDNQGHTAVKTTTITVGDDTPTADFTFLPASPTVGANVAFNGSTSSAVAGRTITSYTWTFGDGATASGPTATHAFGAAGVFNVTLTVIDSQGKSKSKTIPVTVTP